ncbi:hypothetical protein MMC27_003136 [Xylographa pallens]|nr:hypothetical protein [Xylographa pallens]
MPTTSLDHDTKTLPSRPATPQEQAIIDEVLSLYQAKPTDASYAHYAPTAVFHDPVPHSFPLSNHPPSLLPSREAIPRIHPTPPHPADSLPPHQVSIATGLDSIKAQFNGMPKLFASSTTEACRVLDDPSQPHAIRLDLTQRYVFKTGPAKTLNSLVTLRLANGMIEHHEEEWDHKENKTAEDGFMGRLSEWRKKADAKLVEKMVPADPNKV